MAIPQVLVLLATHNGAQWLDEQLDSIVRQTGVNVRILASDDASVDSTKHLLCDETRQPALHVLPDLPDRLGNAHRNFLRLICDAAVQGVDYVALADQDDVWLPSKLQRAIAQIQEHALDAYSSDVTAFWPDGREHYLKKSSPQRERDYLLEAAGPGCTYVWPVRRFMELQSWAQASRSRLEGVRVHDWLIYAFARRQGWRWLIDPVTGLRYRQHSSNEVGANVGIKAALHRVRRIRSGSFREDIVGIADAVGDHTREAESFRRFWLRDRLFLICRAPVLRRRAIDSIYLMALIGIMR